jgi:hypothetical protein
LIEVSIEGRGDAPPAGGAAAGREQDAGREVGQGGGARLLGESDAMRRVRGFATTGS